MNLEVVEIDSIETKIINLNVKVDPPANVCPYQPVTIAIFLRAKIS